ncbi:MAG: hypothetical protein ABR936_17275 [Bacteroidota bacterium]|jgi:hypothetical protein
MNYPTFTELYPYAIGYSISLFISHFLIRWTIDPMWKAHGDPRKNEWFVASLNQGLIERLMFTTSWLVDKPAFIGIWLALKVASQWKGWSEKAGYNIFLVGSGLSILYAVLGAMEISWINQCSWKSILVPLLIVIGNMILILYNRIK